MKQLLPPAVWIVDDDEDDQLFIRSAFQDSNPSIEVVSLNDGEELFPRLIESVVLPRLILLDINMPRKDGFETLKELRRIPEYASLPIVMLTTSSADEDCRRCMALGASDFLTKPLTYQQLKQMADKLTQEWDLS